MTKAQRVKWKN